MKTYIYYLLIFSALILCFWNCSCDRKDPDPCKDIPKSSAEFYSSDFPSKYLDADTFLNDNTILFKAKDTTANSYEWQFGDDPKKYTKSYKQKLTFDVTALGAIKANLKIIKKKSTYTCYPNDDSIKTFSKNIFFVSRDEIPYLGWWKGSFNNTPKDTFSFEVRKVYNVRSLKYTDISLVGFPPNCDSVSYHKSDFWGTTYYYFTLEKTSFYNTKSKNCPLDNGIPYSKLNGYYNSSNKTMRILYTYIINGNLNTATQYIPLTFTGIRLNK